MSRNENSLRAANTRAAIEKAPFKILFVVIIVLLERCCKVFVRYRVLFAVIFIAVMVVMMVFNLGFTAGRLEVLRNG